jgi:CSLREA domain-containing protein
MSPVAASRRLSASRVLPFLFANLGLFAPLLLAPAQSAAAATDTFYVHVTSDDFSGSFSNLNGTAANCPANSAGGSASCSLRDAITAANADANPVIVDMTAVSGTITLANPLPGIFQNAREHDHRCRPRRRYTHGLRRERLPGFPDSQGKRDVP